MSFHSVRWLRVAAVYLLVACWAAPVTAQDDAQHATHGTGDSQPITLDEVLEQIEVRNPQLRAARLNADALATVPDQVSAWPDPVLGVGYQPFPMLTAHGAQRTQWTAEQSIPFPGKLSLKREIASLDAEAAEHDSEAVLDELLLQAKVAYYELYRLNELEQLIARFETDLAGFEEAAAVRYEVGQGPQQALLKAQLEKNQLTQRLHHVEGARRRAAETLARLTNHPDGPRAFLTMQPLLTRIDDHEGATLAETALQRRPEFAALEAAAQRAARQVELARKEAYPDFGLSITYFDIAPRDAPSSASSGRDAVAIGASVRIPLQRGRIAARVEEARLRQAHVEAQQEALRTEYRTRIEEILAALEHEALAIDEYETVLLPQATSTVEAVLSAYSTGTSDFLELLDAQRTIFGLRTGYVDAVARYLTLTARLERVLGVRSLEDVHGLTASIPSVQDAIDEYKSE